MKDFKIYIIGGCLLLLVYVVIEYNKPKPVIWRPTLYKGDKIPFGTLILHDRLQDLFPGAQVTHTNQSAYNVFKELKNNSNYIIIAKSVNISKPDFEQMVKYIREGNNVFISTFTWSGFIADTLRLDVAVANTKTAEVNFNNKQLRKNKYYRFNKDISAQYFSDFDTTEATVLSSNRLGKANFLRYSFGKGNLLVCANPELFTNYSLLTSAGADYSAKALSYLPATKNIYWDQYQNHDIAGDESPMRVFLNNTNLQWAYYLSLCALVIFVLFEIKRRQRIIPVIDPLKNTTLDFVNVVGQVYYEKRDNANIAHKKILYLLTYLREQYRLQTNTINNDFAATLAHKTGVDISIAQQLVEQINLMSRQSHVSDKQLIDLNHLIEKFYKQI